MVDITEVRAVAGLITDDEERGVVMCGVVDEFMRRAGLGNVLKVDPREV